jgi:hypothetical protein
MRSSDLATAVVDGGTGFDIIYLDFEKVFHKMPRERLLNKSLDGSVVGSQSEDRESS